MAVVLPKSSKDNVPSKDAAFEAVYKVGVEFYTDYMKDGSIAKKCRAHLLSKFIDDPVLFDAIRNLGSLPLNIEEKMSALRAALFDVLMDAKKSKKA